MTKQQFASEAQALAPSLRRIALSIVHSEHDVQDAVQQALLGVWERRERVDASRLRAYLTRAVINACRDVQRARMRSVPVEAMPECGYEPPDTALRDAVDALPEKLRTPLLLHYMEGYSEKEIAQALRLSLPQLKSRMFRARRKLRAMLAEEAMEG